MTKRYPLNFENWHLASIGFAPRRGDVASVGDGPPARGDHNAMPDPEDILALAKFISGARAMRKSDFPAELFGEPAWEMLLALFCADRAGYRMSVSNMCLASGSPTTTALRWIEKLEELGMITRRKNPLDARIFFIELVPETGQLIEDYLMKTWVAMSASK